MKTCSKCLCEKPVGLFSKKLNGLQSKCKDCCKVEHSERYAKNRSAQQAKKREAYKQNAQALREKQRSYYQANKDARLAYIAEWRKANPGYASTWYESNAERERERAREWKASNPDRTRVQEHARRARTRRIPPWADTSAMADTYRRARELRDLGVECHVDHVIPLRGKTVSGLHVQTNLEIILAVDNLKKGAHYDEQGALA